MPMADSQQAAGVAPGHVGKVFLHFTMSLDGFVADSSGGLSWAFRFAGPSADAVREMIASIGAALGGRRGYDKGMMRGEAKLYGGAWTGPQFVFTHRPGDATPDPAVTFLSGSLRDAIQTARAAARGLDVVIVGVSIAQQCLAEGLADEILIHLVPVVLGNGIRLFANSSAPPVTLEPISTGRSGDLTDLRFKVVR
jgi:dihydrofolate reductase